VKVAPLAALWLLAAAGGCEGGDGAGPGAPASGGATYVYAGGGTSIGVFRADLATGALTWQAAVQAGNDAYLAEVDPARKRAYVQSQLGLPVVIRAYEITATGVLKLVGDHPLPHPAVEGVSQMQFHPSAPWLLISATGGATGLEDQLLPVGGQGQLGMPKVISTEFYGFTWDPTGKYFYGLDGVAISQFTFDAAAGSLAKMEPPLAEGSTGHQFLALRGHPNGKWVYSVEEGSIGLFDVDAARGTLAVRSYAPNPVGRQPMAWTSLVMHPSGRFLYAVGTANTSQAAIIDVFAIDAGTGALTFVEREQGGESHQLVLENFQTTPLVGDLLVVGGRARGNALDGQPALAVYRVSATDGSLQPVGDPVPVRAGEGTIVNFVFAVTLPATGAP
jgi:6-phosphogluconolactonase (cycloisomerase 2 family)